jgi:hypothetical protein
MQLQNIQNKIYTELKTTLPRDRRALLIQEMQSLTENKIHCFNCTGTCCTMSANSMQVTPLEAFEMLLSLELTENNVEEIKNKLKENIVHYRLDHEVSLGKKAQSHLRKTYTCPFFVPGPKGCTIKKELKPYGCLGFNPRLENDNGSSCHSDQKILEQREDENNISETAANDYLKKTFKIYWTKMEIPKALLFLIENFPDSDI